MSSVAAKAHSLTALSPVCMPQKAPFSLWNSAQDNVHALLLCKQTKKNILMSTRPCTEEMHGVGGGVESRHTHTHAQTSIYIPIHASFPVTRGGKCLGSHQVNLSALSAHGLTGGAA